MAHPSAVVNIMNRSADKPVIDHARGGRPPRGADVAVVVIDMQNDFCLSEGAFAQGLGVHLDDLDALTGTINRLIAAGRAANALIVHTRMVFDTTADLGLLARGFLADGGLRRDTWGAELIDALDVQAQDLVVDKPRFNAFLGTDLQRLLDERGIGRLVVAGVRTDYCVESTVREAFMRDYEVVVPRECVAGYFPTLHDNSLTEMGTIFAEVVSLAEAMQRLAVGSKNEKGG